MTVNALNWSVPVSNTNNHTHIYYFEINQAKTSFPYERYNFEAELSGQFVSKQRRFYFYKLFLGTNEIGFCQMSRTGDQKDQVTVYRHNASIRPGNLTETSKYNFGNCIYKYVTMKFPYAYYCRTYTITIVARGCGCPSQEGVACAPEPVANVEQAAEGNVNRNQEVSRNIERMNNEMHGLEDNIAIINQTLEIQGQVEKNLSTFEARLDFINEQVQDIAYHIKGILEQIQQMDRNVNREEGVDQNREQARALMHVVRQIHTTIRNVPLDLRNNSNTPIAQLTREIGNIADGAIRGLGELSN